MLTILVIDRPLKENESVVKDIFLVYGKLYDLIIFPPKVESEECIIQVIFLSYSLVSVLEKLFSIMVDYDFDDPPDFFDFDLSDIEEEVFYNILDQNYTVVTAGLTEII